MKLVKTIAVTAAAYLITIQQAFAQGDIGGGNDQNEGGGTAVPELDGPGAILAIGLVLGLVALFREKFR